MPNAKEIKMDTSAINFLITGEMGTGKSCFARTFPTPAYLFDLDNQAMVYRGKDFDYDQFALSERGFHDFMKRFDEVMRTTDYKTVVIDSVTSLAAICMQHAMQLDPRRTETGGALWNVHYSHVTNLVEGLLKRFLCYPAYKVVIAHLKVIRDEKSGAVLAIQPNMPGNLGVTIPPLFGEIYVSNVRETQSGREYGMMTKTQGMLKARSNFSNGEDTLPPIIPNNFSKLMEHIYALESRKGVGGK